MLNVLIFVHQDCTIESAYKVPLGPEKFAHFCDLSLIFETQFSQFLIFIVNFWGSILT